MGAGATHGEFRREQCSLSARRPSRVIHVGIRLTFRLERPRQRQVETDIFGRILPRQRRSWLPLFGSMLAHGALLVLVPVIADEVAKTYSDDIDWSVFRVEPMRLRVPDVIYYTAP